MKIQRRLSAETQTFRKQTRPIALSESTIKTELQFNCSSETLTSGSTCDTEGTSTLINDSRDHEDTSAPTSGEIADHIPLGLGGSNHQPLDVFNHDCLSVDVAVAAKEAATRIRFMLQTTTLTPIEIGRELLVVKESLGHGQFNQWLREEFDWGERTAQRYMRLAEAFGTKPDTMSGLPVAVLHRLAATSTPSKVREEVLALLEAGERLEPSKILKMLRLKPPEQSSETQEPENNTAPGGSEIGAPGPQPGTETAPKISAGHSDAHAVDAAEAAACFIRKCAGLALMDIAELLRAADPHRFVQALLVHLSEMGGAPQPQAPRSPDTEGGENPEGLHDAVAPRAAAASESEGGINALVKVSEEPEKAAGGRLPDIPAFLDRRGSAGSHGRPTVAHGSPSLAEDCRD